MNNSLKTYISNVDVSQSESIENINNKIDFSIMNNDKNTNELLTNIKEFQKEVNQDLKSMDNSIMEFRKFQVATILSIIGVGVSLVMVLIQFM